MPELTQNIGLLSPEFALAGLALGILAIDLFLPDGKKQVTPWLSAAGLAGIIALSLYMLWGRQETLYGGLLAVDAFSLFFKVFFLGLGILIIFTSMEYVDRRLDNPGEFYGLLLLSILGMNVMAQSRELLTAYIALELLSFCLYVMAAYAKGEPKSNEAGLKYILIGAFSSAILLYGVSMIYSSVGVTRFADISLALGSAGDVSPALWAGLALLVVGLGFKVSAVPFHMWAPDVYEGAPLPVTAYLAIGSKAAAFALILRLVAEGFVPAEDLWSQWQIIFAVLAAVTMLVGNLVALAQTNLKRLMAYSSIGHVGFLLAGIAALAPSSVLASNGVMLYLVGYSITNLLVFAAIIAFFNLTGREEIVDLAGLADRQPFLAACIAIGFFSLGGLPIFAGFAIKFYLFVAVATGGFLWLAGLAIFASLISIYYYLKVIRQMYIEPVPEYVAAGSEREDGIVYEPEQNLSPSFLMLGVLAISMLAVVLAGVYPAPLLDLIEAASQAILPGA
ncbi:MAG: hypothetical protein BZY80_01685 [SAR202 cluster bacterium Io17-Chloro-G2]|nr:MAG: hypothetical protein BZY80_01685 [SAR202 cluster bacterium Io17-Chloro-G2]